MRSLDLTVATWRKSSYSNQDGGECVEISHDFATVIPVRDSKTPKGPVLLLLPEGWTSFVTAVKNRELGA